jgi:hypothetical protein
MTVKIYIENKLIDLFNDESIEINSSVTDIGDITKNTTDYSKSFTVPATSTNNQIFKHYYNANIDNTFDARVKVNGRIELDGLPFKDGKFRLDKVSVKRGKPSSYTINFFGNLISLKDILKDDELTALDFDYLDFNYQSAEVINRLTTGYQDVIYSLISKRQLFFKSGTDNTFGNIAFTGGNNTGIKWNELKPSLRVKRIIDAIEVAYPVKFSRDFFGRSEFENLFIWLNNSIENKEGGGVQRVDFNGGSTTYVDLSTDVCSLFLPKTTSVSIHKYTALELSLTVTPAAGSQSKRYKIRTYKNDTLIKETEYIGTQTTVSVFKSVINTDTNLSIYYEVVHDGEFTYSASLQQKKVVSTTAGTNDDVTTIVTTTASNNSITQFLKISNHLPKIKIIDFLKALFNMFKLVVVPQKDGTLLINTINDYYSDGKVYDITHHVDYESYEVERGDLLNTIKFNYEDPTTILNKQFKLNNSLGYGELEQVLKDESGVLLDGGSLEIKIPFEQMVFERLRDLNGNALTDIQYGASISDTLEPVTPKLLLYYPVQRNLNTNNFIGLLDETNVRFPIGSINIPSATMTLENATFSTVFGNEFSTWNGQLIENTLYSNYYQDYINSIFNIKRRTFKFKAKLPLPILTKLQMNDVLIIKENYYRLSSYNANLLNNETTLVLINSFDDRLLKVSTNVTEFNITKDYQLVNFYVTNGKGAAYQLVDNGFGTSMVDFVEKLDNNFRVAIKSNFLNPSRSVYIKIEPDLYILINQI